MRVEAGRSVHFYEVAGELTVEEGLWRESPSSVGIYNTKSSGVGIPPHLKSSEFAAGRGHDGRGR